MALTELALTELALTELALTELALTELARTELARTEFALTELAFTELARTELLFSWVGEMLEVSGLATMAFWAAVRRLIRDFFWTDIQSSIQICFGTCDRILNPYLAC